MVNIPGFLGKVFSKSPTASEMAAQYERPVWHVPPESISELKATGIPPRGFLSGILEYRWGDHVYQVAKNPADPLTQPERLERIWPEVQRATGFPEYAEVKAVTLPDGTHALQGPVIPVDRGVIPIALNRSEEAFLNDSLASIGRELVPEPHNLFARADHVNNRPIILDVSGIRSIDRADSPTWEKALEFDFRREMIALADQGRVDDMLKWIHGESDPLKEDKDLRKTVGDMVDRGKSKEALDLVLDWKHKAEIASIVPNAAAIKTGGGDPHVLAHGEASHSGVHETLAHHQDPVSGEHSDQLL